MTTKPTGSNAGPQNQFGAELGSMLASLGELARRIDGVAQASQSQQGGGRLAADLFAVETSLRTAHRRLDKVVISLGR